MSGIGSAEKLKVQKPEVLGAVTITHMQRDDYQPKQAQTIQSAQLPPAMKDPQTAVTPPTPVVDLSKTDDEGKEEREIEATESKAADPVPREKVVIRRFWTSSWKPLNVNDLEPIGPDSKGYTYWYDGGRNMFQSPPTSDPKQRPKEADMQLVCKSMVQWMGKLKELKTSKMDQDTTLAQTVKEFFIPRVKIITQRKPRDSSALVQVIQASKTQQQQQQQQQKNTQPHPQTVPSILLAQPPSAQMLQPTSSQAATTTAQSTDQPKGHQQIVQPTFPQGSILVVPHQHRYQTLPLLPVFTNTAVIMPAGVAKGQQGVIAPTTVAMAKGLIAPTTNAVESGASKDKVEVMEDDKKTRRREDGEEGERERALKGEEEKREKEGGESTGNQSVIQSVSKEVVKEKEERERKKRKAHGTTTNAKESKSHSANVAAGAMIIGKDIPFRQALALGIASYVMRVGNPVQLMLFDFHSKSVEISGEVPIRALERKGEEDEEEEISIARARELAEEMIVIGKDEEKNVEDEVKREEKQDISDHPQPSTTEDQDDGPAHKSSDITLHQEVLKGHTSTEVMSAKMLLSLTGRPEIEISPLDKEPPQPLPEAPVPPLEVVAPSADTVLAATPPAIPNNNERTAGSGRSGRKRKQKPTPSAKPTKVEQKEEKVQNVAEEKSFEKRVSPAKTRRGKKGKGTSEEPPEKAKSGAKPKKVLQRSLKEVKIDQLSPQELLSILNIPPTVEIETAPKSQLSLSQEDEEEQTASVRMEQLKAERGSRPVKEFVIESSASESGDESDSSSGSGSTSFSPNSGSSSESSSGTSSDSPPTEPKSPPQKKNTGRGRGGRGRGRGAAGGRRRGGGGVGRRRGGGRGRPKVTAPSSSSGESSDEEKEEKKEPVITEQRKRKRQRMRSGKGRRGRPAKTGRGRGRSRGTKRVLSEHIVSIPTELITFVPTKKRRKQSKESTDKDVDHNKQLRPVTNNTSYLVDPPTFSSFYTTGDVDLGTLSELTKSVQETKGKNMSDGDTGGLRSKRTCVRVREEISRLEEILDDGHTAADGRGTKAPRGRGRSTANRSGENAPSRKYRRAACRNQFTQRRRRKRKKQPEEEALWQPARKIKANENLHPVYVFSTHLANSAADAVLKGRYNSIVQFHNAQPKGPGFIRQVQQKEIAGKREGVDAVKSPNIERDGGGGWEKAPKRRSEHLSVSEDTPVQKKLRSSGQARSSPALEDSNGGPGTRYSRRIRRQQASSISSPPSSPTSNQSTDEGGSPKLNPLRSRGRVGGGRRSGVRVTPLPNSNQKEEEGEEKREEEEEEEEEGEEESKVVGGRASLSKDEEGRSGERKDGTLNSMPQDSNAGEEGISPHHPMRVLPQMMASHRLLPEEDNYTICHGTPRSRGNSAVDMSSPAAKAPAGSRPSDMTSPVDNHGVPNSQAAAHPNATNPTHGGGPGERDGGERDHSKLISPARIAGLHAHDPMIAQNIHVHHDYHKEPNNWAAGIGPQFSAVPGGYYGHGIHPMHYPANPAARHVPHANYPFGVPYPWGHTTMGPHSRTPESGQHHYAGQTDSSVLHARSVETSPSTQSFSHPPPHMAYPHYYHSPHAAAHTPASSDGGKSPASIPSDTHVSSPSTASSTSPTVMKNPSLVAPQAHHAQLSPHAALRQLSSPGSAQPSLPVHHAFPRPSHPHPLAPEHPSGSVPGHHPSAPFSYGIDPNNPAALHMHPFWQHPQMQQHPMRPIPGVHPSHLPPHLQPAPGMWYPHPLMQGGVPEDPTKRRMQVPSPIPKHVDSAHLRLNTNRNNSNNVPVNIEVPSNQQSTAYLTKNTSGQFSVQYLTSQEKSPSIHMASNQPPSYLAVVAVEGKSSQSDYAGVCDSVNLHGASASKNGEQHQVSYDNVLHLVKQDYAKKMSQLARQAEDPLHLSSIFPR